MMIELSQIGVGLWSLMATSLFLSLVSISLSVVAARKDRLGRKGRLGGVEYAAKHDEQLNLAGSQLLPEFEQNHRTADSPLTSWTPEAMRLILEEGLADAQVILVSNREPYIHNLNSGKIDLVIPASGLVSALEPVMRACGGTWIAHGGGTADQIVVDNDDCIAVPPGEPLYSLSRVWLSEEEQKGHYLGFSNEGLWPLCHIAFTRPVFRASDWEIYKSVNQKFAQRVVKEASSPDPVVLVQDYHFALVPRMVREHLPEATIITFWHIPWPNSEVFSICPWREQILEGLLGSSIVGFHIQFHCNNFIESVDRCLESRIEREHFAISYGGQSTLIHSYPISIEWPPSVLETLPSVTQCRADVVQRYGLASDSCLFVGVERLDYTKGIIDRFLALEQLFEQHPELIGKVVFLQIAAPSRGKLAAYKKLHESCTKFVNAFNQRYGLNHYRPIILLDQHHTQHDIFTAYRAADVCVVSSLHDGMNLVAKEFVAARDDERGVLVLSTFAGASSELLDALIVNPFDPYAMGEAMYRALTMPIEEQSERMRRMREVVRSNNVYRWAGSMLQDAARLRKRTMPLIGGAPEPVSPSTDRDDHLVQVPNIV